MRCPACERHLGAYFERALGARRARAIEAHLRDCANCRALYHELRVVDGLLHTSRPLAPPSGVVAAVMTGVRARPHRHGRHVPAWLVGTLYLAVAWLAIAALWASSGVASFVGPLAALQDASARGLDAYAAIAGTLGPFVPTLAAIVIVVLFLDAALLGGVLYFYRHLRPRLAAHLTRTESATP